MLSDGRGEGECVEKLQGEHEVQDLLTRLRNREGPAEGARNRFKTSWQAR
jgi:hypothetical protein